MSRTVAEIDECVEPSSVIIAEPRAGPWLEEAKLASRQLAVARGAAKNAWLMRSAGALAGAPRRDPGGQRARRRRRAGARARTPRRSTA